MVPIIWFSLKKGLRPLGRLSAELEQIRPHELDRRLETALLPHELSPVVESLNAWLARLENSFERERQFTANAAHELRSPLAELKMMAELGAMAPEEATPERFTEVVAVVDELTGLLDKLAKLAESEIDGHDVSWTEWNLAEAVGEGTTRLRDRAAERRLVFQTEIGPGCFFTDPFIWRTIFDNLLSNAVEYSPEGSTIFIAASPEKLYLRNLAPDLTRDDLDHLFDRFWRKEHKRFPQGHSGLGLSIVRGYVACLGGECHVSLTADHELVVEIRWGDHLAGTREGVG
jgi:signal transduction histidine kinase